jgi:hypothetical protein
VNVCLSAEEVLVSTTYDLMSARTPDCFPTGILCNVVTSSLETSCKCLFHMRKGTWVLRKEFQGAGDRIHFHLGHNIVITLVVVQGRAGVPCINSTAGPISSSFWCFVYDSLASQWSRGKQFQS